MAVTNQNTNTEEENVITLSDSDLPTLNNNSKLINPVGDISKLINPVGEPIRSYGDDPFSNFGEGFVRGTRGLIANFNYALSEFVDDPIKEFDMKKWSDEVIANSPDEDGSVGQWIGQLVPSVVPVAGAVVTSMIPGGQPIAGTLGNIALGTLSFSSAGAGLRQYDKDKVSAGLDPSENQGERFAIATIYGATEAIFEKFALNKFLPKSVTSKIKEPIGKLISQGNKIEPKVANRVVANFIKKKPSVLKKYASIGNREGWTEAATSLSQDLADLYFLENKPTLTQIRNNIIESYGAGVLMGSGIGVLSFKSQDLATKRRREAQGDVYLTQHEGVTKEVLGKSGNENNVKFNLLEADGNVTSVNENEIGEVLSISNKQFENILSSKDYDNIINDEIYTVNKNIELETERVAFQELEKFADTKGALFNNEGKRTYNVIKVKDREYLVTSKDKNNPKIVYGFDIDAFGQLGQDTPMIPINIDNADSKIKSWTENEMQNFYKEAQIKNAEQELGTPNAVKGESITYEGEVHDVLGTFEGVVNLKNRVSGDDVQIDKKTYNDLKSVQQDLNPAKKSKDDIPINEDGSIGAKPSGDQSTADLPTFNIGRAKYKVSEMNDKTSEMVIGRSFTIEETANKTAENLSKNYGNLDFEVVNETDTSDLMAKNKFVIKAKPKGKKVDPFKAVKDKAKEVQGKEKIFSPAADDVLKAIETNQGKEQADAFKKEYDRLVNKLIQERQKKKGETKKQPKKPVKKAKPKSSETKSKSNETKPKRVIKKKPIKGTITKKGDIKMSKEFLDRLPFYDPVADSGIEYTRQIDPYIKGNVKRVEAVIKRLTGTWRKAPKVKVYQSFADFVPNNAVNNTLEYANTNAFYDPDTDQIVFFANQFLGLPNSVIERKLYHEAVGHQGLKGLLSTKDFDGLMDGVYNDIMLKNNDKLSNNIAFTYIHTRYNPNLEFDPNINYLEANRPDGKPMSLAETREIAEEYIAHKIEDPKFSKSANNLAGSFKNAISSLTGKEFTINNNDIKRIINSATQYIEKDGSLFNKNIIKYSLSSKYNTPNQEILNKIRESRNLKRGDDIDNGKYRPELDRTVKKLNQDDFEAILKGKVVEPALYDVLTTGDASIYNPVFDFSTDMKGLKGGPNNLFLKENIKNNIAVSYTKITKAAEFLNFIKNKKVDYVTYVLTGTGSNLTANIDFRKAMFGEDGFTQKVMDNGIDFIEFRDDFIERARGEKAIDNILDNLSKTKTIKEFGEAIINLDFGNAQKIANKIFPKTVGTPSVNIMQTKYGFPTKDGVIGSLADPMFVNALGGDIVSVSKPDPTTLYVNETEYNALAKSEIKKYEDMGYKVLVTPKEAEHPSYPYAIGGEAIGVLDQFQNFTNVYTKLDKDGKNVIIEKTRNPNYELRRSAKVIDKFNVYKKTNRGPSEDPFVTQKISVAPIRYFDQYIKDVVKGEDVKASDVADIINKRDFNSYRKSIVDTSALFGLKVSNVTNNIEVDNQDLLFSNTVDVKGTKEDIKAFAVAMATFKDQKKKVIVSEVKEGSATTDLDLFLNKGVDIDKFMDSAKKNGIIDGKFDINLNKFSIFGVGLEVDSNIQNFIKEQKNNVKKIEHKEVESEFIQENEYKRILKKYRISQQNQGKLGNNLNQFISNIKVRQSRSLQNIDKIFGESSVDYVAGDKINLNEFKRLSGGTTRDVYDLGKVVIKVAKSPKGIEQNESLGFGDAQMLAPFIPEQYEKGLDYIVMENVPRNDKAVNEFLKPLREFTQQDFDMKTSELQEVLYEKGLDDFMSYSLLWNDFTAKRNWGQRANGDFVLVDEGALNPNVTAISKPSVYAVQDWEKVKRLRKTNNIRQSRNLNYSEDYQNNLHSEMIMYLKKHPEDNLTARTWLNKLFGNTDLTVQDLKWMGIYNQMMDKNRILQKNNVIDIIANSKYKTIDLNKDSKVKEIIVTTDFNGNIKNGENGFNYFQSFTRYPIAAEIKAKFINNGEYDIVRVNKIKGDEEVAIKELIKKSNYEDIFAIAYENKQMLNKIKTKYDFNAIVDKIKLSGKEYGLLIISPKLKEQSRGDMGLRHSQNLPQGFDDNSFMINQEYMRYYMQDKMIYLKRLQEYVESKGYKVADDSNAYVKENLSKGKVQVKTERFHKTYFEPMIKHIGSITKQGRVDYQEISDFVYGLHARERRKYVDPGISIIEQERYIKNGETKIGARDRNKLINMIKEITRFNVTQAYNYGLMTKQNFNKFMPRKGKSKTAMFDFYVPLRGFEKSEFDNTAFSYVNMKAKGRGGFKADDPLAYMYIMAQSTIIQGEKNNTKKALLNFVRQFPNPNLYEIKNMYFEMGDNKIQETDIKPTGDFKYALDPFQDAEAKAIRRFEGNEADMTVFEEGRKKVITFIGKPGKRLVDGFKGYNVNREGMLGTLYSGADAVSQVMRKTFTQYSPEFIPINFIRDITSGYINIRNDFGGKIANEILSEVGQSFKTLKQYYGSKNQTLPKGDEGTFLAQFIENGSKTGWSQLKTVDEIKQDIDNYAKSLESADKTSFKKIIQKPLRMMDTINTVLENTVRFAAFKKLVKGKKDGGLGLSLDKASIYAKDLTVNFNRKGYIGNTLNSLFLFYNAGIQGVERLARPLANKKTRYQTAASYFLALPMIGLITQMLSRIITGEDEEQDKYYYDLLPEYTRTHNLILPNPLVLFKSEEELKKMNTRDRFITIPLPYGHNVFMASPDHMTRAILGVESPSEAFLNTIFTGVESFSPLGPVSNEGRDDLGFMRYVTPTTATPFVDLFQNRNFAGSPIYREDSPYAKTKTPSSLRHFNSVNPAIKAVTDFFHNASGGTSVEDGVIEINPEIPEFLLTSYLGGVASLVINTGTLAIHNGKEIIGIETPKKEGDLVIGDYNVGPLRKLPFVRRFITEVSPFSASEDYYKYKEKIDDVVGKKKKYLNNLKDGSATREQYKDFIQDPENKELLRLENVLKSYDKQIKNLRDIKERHIANENAVKEEQIQRKINQLYKKFNKFVNVKELRTLDDIMSFIQE